MVLTDRPAFLSSHPPQRQGHVSKLAGVFKTALDALPPPAAAAAPLTVRRTNGWRKRCFLEDEDRRDFWAYIEAYNKELPEAANRAKPKPDPSKLNHHPAFFLEARPDQEEADYVDGAAAKQQEPAVPKFLYSLHYAVGSKPGREKDGKTVAFTTSSLRRMVGPLLMVMAELLRKPVALLVIDPVGVWDEPDACQREGPLPPGFAESFPVWLHFLDRFCRRFPRFDLSVHSGTCRSELTHFLRDFSFSPLDRTLVVDQGTGGRALGLASAVPYDGEVLVLANHDSWKEYSTEDRAMTALMDASCILKTWGSQAVEVAKLPPRLGRFLVEPDAPRRRQAALNVIRSHFALVYHVATTAGFKRRALESIMEEAGIAAAAAHIFALEVAFIASSIWPTYEHLQQKVPRRLLAAATGAAVQEARKARDEAQDQDGVASLEEALMEQQTVREAALGTPVAAPGVGDGSKARVTLRELLSYLYGRHEAQDRPISERGEDDEAAQTLLFLFARRLNHLRRSSRGGVCLCMWVWGCGCVGGGGCVGRSVYLSVF